MFAQHVMKLLLFASALVSCCAAAPASDTQLTTNEELATDDQLTIIEELTSEDQGTTTEEGVNQGQFTTTDEPMVTPEYKTSSFLKTTTIVSTPPAVFIGKRVGGILQCLETDPTQCEVFHETSGGYGNLIAHMEYLYAAGANHILKCKSTTKHSCESIYKTSNVTIWSIAIGDGKIFAGLGNGTLLVSNLHETSGFQTFHTFTGKGIYSLKHMDGWLYAGLEKGNLMRCSTTKDNVCTLKYDMKSDIIGLATISDTIIGVTFDGRLWNCSLKDETNDCVSVALDFDQTRAITVFNGDVYVLKQIESLYKCKLGNDPICSKYAANKEALSMAFVYGTHLLQPQYRNENKACTWQRHSKCPPYVTYYNTQQRAALQVYVKDGKLYNSEGALVDTRDADEGHSGPAAIFAMSPDGTILLSNAHNGMFHISSLFAGSPVSGAGEMIVVDGVIQKMIACSDHYLPDLKLNKQVIQSLASQGYTEPIESVSCCKGDEYVNTSTNLINMY